MKQLIYTCLAINLLLLGCKSDPPENSNTEPSTAASTVIDPGTIKLICQTADEPNSDADAPRHEVFLLLGTSKVKVADILNCETIGKDTYEQYQIPPNALAAAGGWWAGAGDYIYVVEENGNYVVKVGATSEESENNDMGYKTVMTFGKDGSEVF